MDQLHSPNSEFNRLSLRLEHILHIDSMLTRGGFPESVGHVFNSDFGEIEALLRRKSAFGDAQVQASDARHLEQLILAHIEEEAEVFGWLVKASQREFRVVDNGELHFPWQPIRTAWIYARTYESALDIACTWADDYYRQAWGEGEDNADEND